MIKIAAAVVCTSVTHDDADRGVWIVQRKLFIDGTRWPINSKYLSALSIKVAMT